MHVSGASLWLPRCFRYETYDESSRLDDAGRRNGLENALLQVTIAQDSRAGSSVCRLAAVAFCLTATLGPAHRSRSRFGPA